MSMRILTDTGAGVVKTIEDTATSALDNVNAFIRMLPVHLRHPEISDGANGSYILEWETDNVSAYVDISEHEYSFSLTVHKGKTLFRDGSADDMKVIVGILNSRLV